MYFDLCICSSTKNYEPIEAGRNTKKKIRIVANDVRDINQIFQFPTWHLNYGTGSVPNSFSSYLLRYSYVSRVHGQK